MKVQTCRGDAFGSYARARHSCCSWVDGCCEGAHRIFLSLWFAVPASSLMLQSCSRFLCKVHIYHVTSLAETPVS